METAPFVPSPVWVAPFTLLLLGIAVLPLFAAHFWESNLRKLGVCAVLGLTVLWLYLRHHPEGLVHTASGTNAAFLAGGALLASVIGTPARRCCSSVPCSRPTGSAAASPTRSCSSSSSSRTSAAASPLFLGYLAGVPFAWTLRLTVPWLFTTALLLSIYYFWDRREHAREARADLREDRLAVRPLRLAGNENLALLAGIVPVAAFLKVPWREVAMVALTVVSLVRTQKELREANHFSPHPILEVAAVFAGIFVTMLPALDLPHPRLRGDHPGLPPVLKRIASPLESRGAPCGWDEH